MVKNNIIVAHQKPDAFGNKWHTTTGNGEHGPSFHTQAEAINYGKAIAQIQKCDLTIQGKNGKFREKNSYGNDPFPPKG